MDRTVKVKLPLSRTEREDVYVGVNGRSWLIKRGEEVELPWYVAMVLQRREMMLSQAMDFEAQASSHLEELEGK